MHFNSTAEMIAALRGNAPEPEVYIDPVAEPEPAEEEPAEPAPKKWSRKKA